MFGLEILEVLIGLVVVYWVLSVVASAITEIVNNILNQRGTHLRIGIMKMLQAEGNEQNPGVAAFFSHPLIKALQPPGTDTKRFPSYIPADTFARVYIQLRDRSTSQHR